MTSDIGNLIEKYPFTASGRITCLRRTDKFVKSGKQSLKPALKLGFPRNLRHVGADIGLIRCAENQWLALRHKICVSMRVSGHCTSSVKVGRYDQFDVGDNTHTTKSLLRGYLVNFIREIWRRRLESNRPTRNCNVITTFTQQHHVIFA